MAQNGLICSYLLDKKGGGNEVDITEINNSASSTPSEAITWTHWNWSIPETREWFEQSSGLDEFIVNAFLAEETRPRLSVFPHGILVILRGVNLNPRSDPEDMVSIRIWIEENRIISARRLKLMAIEDLRNRFSANIGPTTSGEFLVSIATLLIERMEPVICEIMENIDELEEKVIESPSGELRNDIIKLRRQLIMLKRYITPQREVINQLISLNSTLFQGADKNHLRESLDRITRFIEDLDSGRERCTVIQDQLSHHFSEKMNNNMYMLSVIAAIFLPLGFLTGLLGINVGGMPGADNPLAFWIFCVMLSVIAIVGILWLKWKKWV